MPPSVGNLEKDKQAEKEQLEDLNERLHALNGSNRILKEEKGSLFQKVELMRSILKCGEGEEAQALNK